MRRLFDWYQFRVFDPSPLFSGFTIPLRKSLTLTVQLTVKNSSGFYFPRALPGWAWEAKTWSKSKLIQVRNFLSSAGTFFWTSQTEIWLRYRIRYLFDVINVSVRTIKFVVKSGYITSYFLTKSFQ